MEARKFLEETPQIAQFMIHPKKNSYGTLEWRPRKKEQIFF